MDFYLLRNCSKSIALVAVASLFFISGVAHAQMAQNLMIGNAKALALGNAVTADPPGVDSIHFNPAGLARLKGRQSHLKFILADASIKGKFTPGEYYNQQIVNLPHVDPSDPNSALVDPDIAANGKSDIESFAVYLPGNGITEIPFAAAPLGGMSFNPPGSNMTFATAVYAPMMLGLSRADDDPGIYSGKSLAFTRLTFFSPSVGYQVNDTLAVGVSLGFSYAGFGLDLDYRAPNFSVGGASSVLSSVCENDLFDGIIDLCGGTISPFEPIYNLDVNLEKAVSFSFNFGVLWEPTPWLALGFAYQSEANDTLEGDLIITFAPEVVGLYNGIAGSGEGLLDPLLGPIIRGLDLPKNGKIESDGRVNLVTPQHISLGMSLMLTPRLKFNTDVKWTETSKWESFRFEFDEDIVVLELLQAIGVQGVERNALDIPRGYEDTVNWGFGLEYAYTDTLSLRLGYEPRKAGIPDDKLDFVLPLGDSELYAVGFSYAIDKDTTFDTTLGYTKSHQKIPAGSSTNGNDIRADNFVYNPYGGLDVETTLEVIMLEFSYQSQF